MRYLLVKIYFFIIIGFNCLSFGCNTKRNTKNVFDDLKTEKAYLDDKVVSLENKLQNLRKQNCELLIKHYLNGHKFELARSTFEDCKSKYPKLISTSDYKRLLSRAIGEANRDSIEYKAYIKILDQWVPSFEKDISELNTKVIDSLVNPNKYPIHNVPFAEITTKQFQEILSFSEYTNKENYEKHIYLIAVNNQDSNFTKLFLMYNNNVCNYRCELLILNDDQGISGAKTFIKKVPCGFEEYETTRVVPNGISFQNNNLFSIEYKKVLGSLKKDTVQILETIHKQFLISKAGRIKEIKNEL